MEVTYIVGTTITIVVVGFCAPIIVLCGIARILTTLIEKDNVDKLDIACNHMADRIEAQESANKLPLPGEISREFTR